MLTHDFLVKLVTRSDNMISCPDGTEGCNHHYTCDECADMLLNEYEESIRVIERAKYINKKRYLIYVTHYDIFSDMPKTDVYEYEGDVFHAMGEIDFRSECKVYRITYAEYTDVKAKFWTDQGYKIHRWYDKYL